MWIERACAYLQKRWRGPALRLAVRGAAYQLGRGAPRTEVIVHRPALLPRLALSPSLVFGEAYMRGEIEVRGSLLEVLEGAHHTFRAARPSSLGSLAHWPAVAAARRRAIAHAQYHYDIGNDFYRLWLDPSLTYSCACFLNESDDLATAQ